MNVVLTALDFRDRSNTGEWPDGVCRKAAGVPSQHPSSNLESEAASKLSRSLSVLSVVQAFDLSFLRDFAASRQIVHCRLRSEGAPGHGGSLRCRGAEVLLPVTQWRSPATMRMVSIEPSWIHRQAQFCPGSQDLELGMQLTSSSCLLKGRHVLVDFDDYQGFMSPEGHQSPNPTLNRSYRPSSLSLSQRYG